MVICEARRQSYIGEVAVDRGKGENIGVEVDGFIKEKPGLNTEDVIMVGGPGGDSTNLNVGKYTGVFATLEKRWNRAFQRFICLLHLIELLLRHFVRIYVGDTSGPTSSSSDLGQALVNLEHPVIVNFNPIEALDFP